MKERLIDLIIEKAFLYSPEPAFRLVSGRMSNYYFNCKAVTLHPEGMRLIGNLAFDLIGGMDVQGIGGLTLGADPIAYAVAYTSDLRGKPVEAFVVRKNAKSHGTMQWIEGNVQKGDKVVIVDDVITTGKSTIEAISKAKETGLDVVGVIVLIDRQEGGREAIEEIGYRPVAIVTREEVMKKYKDVAGRRTVS
jgi:orotate phosphoribosyltransferase